MKKGIVVGVCLAAVCCCAVTHRSVIKAIVMGDEIPKAPEWHFWVPEDRRRG